MIFVTAGFGEAINHSMNTKIGYAVNLVKIMETIWLYLFRSTREPNMPVTLAWGMAVAVAAGLQPATISAREAAATNRTSIDDLRRPDMTTPLRDAHPLNAGSERLCVRRVQV